MAYSDRIALIEEIEKARDSKVICYLTSLRPNVNAQMSEDAVRIFFDHLLLLPEKPVKRLDIFLCSNGGDGVVPWRLISLLREFATDIGVLLPYRAYSAATMLALGANEIVMHPFAAMGPIDPTVSNEFNPLDPLTQQRLGISVEDVKAYIGFIKETVGIRHEDELIQAVKILAEKVHPLALGNVERFLSQSRMIAKKILTTHMKEESSKHQIDEVIETLASKLYFHGHPINRREAKEDMGLQVTENVTPTLETAMWKLYLEFEAELKNDVIFDPIADLLSVAPAPTTAAPFSLQPGVSSVANLKVAVVESARMSSVFEAERRYVVSGIGAQGEPLVRAEVLTQGWSSQQAPAPAPGGAP